MMLDVDLSCPNFTRQVVTSIVDFQNEIESMQNYPVMTSGHLISDSTLSQDGADGSYCFLVTTQRLSFREKNFAGFFFYKFMAFSNFNLANVEMSLVV